MHPQLCLHIYCVRTHTNVQTHRLCDKLHSCVYHVSQFLCYSPIILPNLSPGNKLEMVAIVFIYLSPDNVALKRDS